MCATTYRRSSSSFGAVNTWVVGFGGPPCTSVVYQMSPFVWEVSHSQIRLNNDLRLTTILDLGSCYSSSFITSPQVDGETLVRCGPSRDGGQPQH